jgi:hypothetical protein
MTFNRWISAAMAAVLFFQCTLACASTGEPAAPQQEDGCAQVAQSDEVSPEELAEGVEHVGTAEQPFVELIALILVAMGTGAAIAGSLIAGGVKTWRQQPHPRDPFCPTDPGQWQPPYCPPPDGGR